MMISKLPVGAFVAAGFGLTLMMAGMSPGAEAQTPVFSKDTGPSAACDAHAKGTAGWQACVGAARAEMPDTELFYAGYWLAKTGRYAEALTYLNLTRVQDEKVLTYIGFATRKQGDVDKALPFYAAALKANPNFVAARAYLGEAYLTKGEPARAKAELAEIATRCGTTCAAYIDLDHQISAYTAAHG